MIDKKEEELHVTVLHIFSGDLWAGAEVMIFNLLKELKGNPDLKIIALSLNKGILSCKLNELGIETHIIQESENSFIKIYLKALSILRRKKINIIHSHRYKENLLALLLARTLKTKNLFSTLHGLPEPLNSRASLNKLLRNWAMQLDRLILKRAFSGIVAVSGPIKDFLIDNYKFHPKQIRIIHNGVDIAGPLKSIPKNVKPYAGKKLYIGTVGRLVPVKDYELFLDIAAEISSRANNVDFSILGEGPLKKKLFEKVRKLGIENRMRFLPHTSDPTSYYQGLDLYLNTSLSEGIPMSILEAMKFRIPIVAPNVGGIPEIIVNNEHGFLLNNRSPKEFASACLEIIHDDQLRNRLVENAFKRLADHFGTSKMSDSYINLYRYGMV